MLKDGLPLQAVPSLSTETMLFLATADEILPSTQELEAEQDRGY